MLTVQEIAPAAYAAILNTSDSRYFFNQMVEYGHGKESDGNKVDYLVFRDKAGEPQAVALVVYYRYHYFFRYANCIFGPTMFHTEPELFAEVLGALRDFCLRKFNVRYIRCNPLLPANLYDDIIKTETDVSADYVALLSRLGFKRVAGEWYSNQTLHVRFIYSKKISGMTYDQILATVDPVLRVNLRKSENEDLKFRYLNYDELDIFDDLLQKTYDRMNTITTVRPEMNRNLYRCFGDKIYFPVVYIDCAEALQRYETLRRAVLADQAKLDERYAAKPSAKYRNLSRDNTDRLNRLQKLTAKVTELQADRGNLIYLCGGCFIESGLDFIHLLGGGEKSLMNLHGIQLLHSRMLQLAVSKGFEYYNLYGCSGLLTPEDNQVDYGVLQFKRAFRGNLEEFIGTYEYCKPTGKF